MPPPIALSKSRLLSFLQCPKKVWLEQYSPELEDEEAFDEHAETAAGLVKSVARDHFSAQVGGDHHRIAHDRGLRAAVAQTTDVLSEGGNAPVFDATFDHEGLTIQTDVIVRAAGVPELIAVTAAAGVEDHVLHDCAIQSWTLSHCGHRPERITIAHLSADIDLSANELSAGMLKETDVTDRVRPLEAGIGEIIASTRRILDELDEPTRAIGPHCQSPGPCPFAKHCG